MATERALEAIPTMEPSQSADFSKEPKVLSGDQEIVYALNGYKLEADNARKGGLNPRDDKWRDNLNLYWNRLDFSKKANWQSREIMPEVPSYVDRFAAALKEALMASPDGFFNVYDPADKEKDLTEALKRIVNVWLTRSGRNQQGQILPFAATFEEQMKMGALMACCSTVTWKTDVGDGRVAIETVDPRFIWLDHTYRNLYRIRRVEVDRHDLYSMAKQKDGKGKAIFNLPQMESLVSSLNVLDQAYKMEASGHGQQTSTPRQPIVLDEYIATVLNSSGEVIADRSLMVLANNQYLIRGPEKNPFWHGNDWMVFAPLVTAPLSVYGRSYMEDFGTIARVFIELTNMILDAVHTSSLKAWAIVPGMLTNPDQISEGLTPNKLFMLEEGMRAKDFAAALELGVLPPESMQFWQAIKNEVTEGAKVNEIGLGQFAPKGRTSATEVNQTEQNSSSLIRSIAQTVEMRYLDPVLDLTWKTGLQHAKVSDPVLQAAAGKDLYQALIARRKELIKRPITFQARGMSGMIRKSAVLKGVLNIMQVVGGNPVLAQAFMQAIDVPTFIKRLFELSDVDLTTFTASDRQKMMQDLAQPLQQAQDQGAAPGGQPVPPGPHEVAGQHMQDLAKTMGVLRKGMGGPPGGTSAR